MSYEVGLYRVMGSLEGIYSRSRYLHNFLPKRLTTKRSTGYERNRHRDMKHTSYTVLPALLITTLLLNPAQAIQCSSCEGPPTFQEEYRTNYMPKVIKTWYGLQVLAPDTPYVAVAGSDKLYFIDTRLDTETAKHVKQNIEMATIPREDGYISIDEIEVTAEVKNTAGETMFVFDPEYARVFFAEPMNRRNPDLKLPEPEPAGDWLVTYDLESIVETES
ncbi:conserved hypothetical protein [Talaromyces stipitatus ATCC 10500]|uniref:Uncharacterized protein n=1 Tax=Talaromyces stipitatus (strain ATCC 10500 / CBS 375.48 / QM 6759 / NRRL 1006) TaxID=441959 RepID=B8MKD3_TALSN|nr:uncharacterized protein TSTA_047370 [Talaromyces stipitatus ATCC 10500]EED15288.1 conserved hypothetical protein [Talaromyces stipitatus ATCC 10500]